MVLHRFDLGSAVGHGGAHYSSGGGLQITSERRKPRGANGPNVGGDGLVRNGVGDGVEQRRENGDCVGLRVGVAALQYGLQIPQEPRRQ